MIQEQKIYMHDVSNNYMRRSLSRSYTSLMLNPVLFHRKIRIKTPIVLSSMYSLSEFAHNKLMPYTAKVRGDLLNFNKQRCYNYHISCAGYGKS